MDLNDLYLLDGFVTRERWRSPLLLLAMAGVALLFFRGGLARVAGCLLIVARLGAMPVTGSGWAILLGIALMGTIAVRRRDADAPIAADDVAEPPEPDDNAEPAPCPACHGVIPSGWSQCPHCGWTYAPH